MRVLQHDFVGFDDFVGVAWAQHEHVGHGAKRSDLLDGLVRWAILSDADGVMRKNVERGDFHQRAETHAGPHVVAEIEKCGTESAQLAERHAVYSRTHTVFAHSEV